MGPEALLQPACELSYVVARDGAEADPPVEAPATMGEYLYLTDLPSAALTVARKAIEDDPAFRRRVAEEATEDDIGRAGYLWLHRPIGWAAEFEDLTAEADVGSVETVPAIGEEQPFENEVSLGNFSADFAFERDIQVGVAAGDGGALVGMETINNGENGSEFSLAGQPAGRSEANAIEDELSSLRGLVDRLSSERKAVSSSARRNEQDLETAKNQPSVFDTDVYTLQSELDAARGELDSARTERDTAVRQHSESLTRQLELEKELERSREMRAEIEREHADADAGMVEIRENLARAEASLVNAEGERDELASQMKKATKENNEVSASLAKLTEESTATTKALESANAALKSDVDGLRSGSDELTSKLKGVEVDLDDVRSKLAQSTHQATEAKALVDALTEEKIDLASRLADTESMLETTRTQLAAVKSDAEAVTADLSNVKAHRDGLSTQVDELHGSLTEALNNLAKVRATSDADRAALKDVRAERDLLRVRVGSLEQIETGLEAKLANLEKERDAFSTKIDQTKNDLIDSERQVREVAEQKTALTETLTELEQRERAVTVERDDLKRDIERLQSKTKELEAARDDLNRQVEQLTEENSSIQSQVVDADRLRGEAAEAQGHALSELAQRLSLVENERSGFSTELSDTQAQLAEAVAALESAQTALADAQVQQREQARFVDTAPAEAEERPADAGSGKLVDTGAKVESDSGVAVDALASVEPSPTGQSEMIDPTATIDMPAGPVANESNPPSLIDSPPPPPAPVVDDQPPPPPPPLVAPGRFDGPASSRPDMLTEDLDEPEEATRPSKRHVWGLGPLLRGDGNSRKNSDSESDASSPARGEGARPFGADTDDVDADGAADLSVPTLDGPDPDAPSPDVPSLGAFGVDAPDLDAPSLDAFGLDTLDLDADAAVEGVEVDVADGLIADVVNADRLEPVAELTGDVEPEADDEIDDIAAAVAKVARGLPDDDVDVPNEEIDSISSELADVLADDEAEDDEDLDEISSLISKTVTDFDPTSLERPNFDEEPSLRSEPEGDKPKGLSGSGGRRVFGGRHDAWDGDDADAGDSEDSDLGDELAEADATSPLALGDSPSLGLALPGALKADDDDDASGDAAPPKNVSGRRQLEVPDELLHDEVEFARHVVSSPDVVLLIDGDSVAKMGWPSLPVAQQRDALVSYLADLSATSGAAPDVVFDGRIGEEESLPASRAVRIRLSTPPTEPAAALDELVDAYPEQWPIAIVTDDEELGRSAVERGAIVMSNGQLLDLFIAD